MKLMRKIFHPVMALIAVQLVWITLVVFWIYWFVGKHREFRQLAEKYRPELLGQGFTAEKYFHPRPSAAGVGYDATSSGGSNLGPTSQKLYDAIKQRVAGYRQENHLPPEQPVPADAITASGSGLDPHISPANAELQARRVARARGLSEQDIRALINQHIEGPDLGMLGDSGVNVLTLNLALDSLGAEQSGVRR